MGIPYKLGINMAGAISAGAYTAGVFDFLVEALDAWEAEKKNPDAAVPRHDLSIEILTGASAGGMCTALGSVGLFDPPNPCPGQGKTWREPTRLYKAWVQQIKIEDLVETGDLDRADSALDLASLLNSETIEGIAKSTLGPPKVPFFRESVSATLRLLLTLTSLRGVPYQVNASNGGTFFELTDLYADQIQFGFDAASATNPTVSGVVDLTNGDAPVWDLMRTSAIASGAVPVALAPQILTRKAADYDKRTWNVPVDPEETPCEPDQPCVCEKSTNLPPCWKPSEPPVDFQVTYVDGGATNNSPFECARRYIAGLNGRTHNERRPEKATASVLTIAPFPGDSGFDPGWDAKKHRAILPALLSLKDALIGQSRFLGESLVLGQKGDLASRYMIAPKDETSGTKPAIQSASLGAFGGFFSEVFRDHDYHLGRYNCQRFLQEWFVLPCENPLIAGGLERDRAKVIAYFKATDKPGGVARVGGLAEAWMPILPLCGGLRQPLPVPELKKMTQPELDLVLDRVFERVAKLLRLLIKPFPLGGLAGWAFGGHVAKKIRATLEPQIKADLERCRCL